MTVHNQATNNVGLSRTHGRGCVYRGTFRVTPAPRYCTVLRSLLLYCGRHYCSLDLITTPVLCASLCCLSFDVAGAYCAVRSFIREGWIALLYVFGWWWWWLLGAHHPAAQGFCGQILPGAVLGTCHGFGQDLSFLASLECSNG